MAIHRREKDPVVVPGGPGAAETASPPSGRLEFFKGFLTRPFDVGSVTPSSQILVRQLLRSGEIASARLTVELGPGTGVLTRALLGAMPADGKLLAIELHPDFVRLLERTISDPRLALHRGRAAELEKALSALGESRADAVLSGIPFSTLPPAEAKTTLEAIRRSLRPGGRFVAYQVRSQVRRLAEPFFGRGQESMVLRNFPPVRIFTWVRGDD